MSKKERDSWIIRKRKGLGSIEGITGKPRLMYQSTDPLTGEEMEIDAGEYPGLTFPEAKTTITPKYSETLGKWRFIGTEEELQEIVDEMELEYEKGGKKGQLIKSANISNRQDPFFKHREWYIRPLVIIGSEKLVHDDNPKERFLRMCLMGSKYTQKNDQKGNPLTAAGMRWEVIKASVSDAANVERANDELELMGSLHAMSTDKAIQISVILGLLYDDVSGVNHDMVKPNLLDAIKKITANPGDTRLFEGKSYQLFYKELKDQKPAELTKKVNIKKGLNTNVIRFREGSYNLKGKPLVGVTSFSMLYNHFVDKNNAEDYETLLKALEA